MLVYAFMLAFLLVVFATGIRAGPIELNTPSITRHPQPAHAVHVRRRNLDVASIASVLVTALPDSLRQVAATNVPAFSTILWEEFLDDRKPPWFLELPLDIQTYLISQLGPRPTADATTPLVLFPPPTASTTSPIKNTTSASTPIQSRSLVPTGIVSAIQTSSTNTPRGQPPTTSSPAPNTSAYSTPYPTSRNDTSNSLTKHQKIGIGLGIPSAILVLGALGAACCFLRRRRQKNLDGSTPPSSPGFIPRFAFQEKDGGDTDHYRPLTRHDGCANGSADFSDWDSSLTISISAEGKGKPEKTYTPPMLCHTHSSNRARGKRTSYTSLNTVPETVEPDDGELSGVFRRGTDLAQPIAPALAPALPATFQIRRKPITNVCMDLKTNVAAHDKAYENMADMHRANHASPGMHPRFELGAPPQSQISPSGIRGSQEITSRGQPYVEDYGPEYHGGYFGGEYQPHRGHTSISRYPLGGNAPMEWPLTDRLSESDYRRRTILWDRVYNP